MVLHDATDFKRFDMLSSQPDVLKEVHSRYWKLMQVLLVALGLEFQGHMPGELHAKTIRTLLIYFSWRKQIKN